MIKVIFRLYIYFVWSKLNVRSIVAKHHFLSHNLQFPSSWTILNILWCLLFFFQISNCTLIVTEKEKKSTLSTPVNDLNEHVLIERPRRYTRNLHRKHTSSSSRRDTNKTELKKCNIFTLGCGFVYSQKTHSRESNSSSSNNNKIITTASAATTKWANATKHKKKYQQQKQQSNNISTITSKATKIHIKSEHQRYARARFSWISYSLSRFITKLSFSVYFFFNCIALPYYQPSFLIVYVLCVAFFLRNICL